MSEVPPDVQIEDKSLGELVALTSANISRLIKSEIELAKLELIGDAKRAVTGGVLLGAAGFLAWWMVILASITLAYGLMAAFDLSPWTAFGIVTLLFLVLVVALAGIGILRLRKSKMSGLRATRRTVTDDLAMLRRSGEPPAITE
jgi:uncharacterized membrane protein YqjE